MFSSLPAVYIIDMCGEGGGSQCNSVHLIVPFCSPLTRILSHFLVHSRILCFLINPSDTLRKLDDYVDDGTELRKMAARTAAVESGIVEAREDERGSIARNLSLTFLSVSLREEE